MYHLPLSAAQLAASALSSLTKLEETVSQGCCQCLVTTSCAAPSSEGLAGEDLLPRSLMWWLTGFSFSWALGLRVSVPCWL